MQDRITKFQLTVLVPSKNARSIMFKERIYFRGFLTNVDASILQVSLNHGFNIEAISEKDVLSFISTLEDLTDTQIMMTTPIPNQCLNFDEKEYYVVSNVFEPVVKTKEKGLLGGLGQFRNDFVLGYLNPAISLMRLFKDGDIRMPIEYYYYIERDKPKGYMKFMPARYISHEPYHLESSELEDLHGFIEDTKLPFSRSFLRLAFENFELSYEIANRNLAFLALMISLETLLNPGQHELTYSISRNTAVLLGRNKRDSKKIYSRIRELYAKRSALVHFGKPDIVKEKDLLELRCYVRESIKEIYKMNKDKPQIMDQLNVCGFGRERARPCDIGSHAS